MTGRRCESKAANCKYETSWISGIAAAQRLYPCLLEKDRRHDAGMTIWQSGIHDPGKVS